MEFYSVVKKNKIILFARKWMKLGDSMLSNIFLSYAETRFFLKNVKLEVDY
jgi:hypothetical protein